MSPALAGELFTTESPGKPTRIEKQHRERLFHPLMQKSNFSATETSAEESTRIFIERFPLLSCAVQLHALCYSFTAES